jgi:hypothetical protein
LKITTPEAYRKAIDRVNELRSAGNTAENHTELAELDGAVAAYEALPNEPDESKGKPTPNPYGKK